MRMRLFLFSCFLGLTACGFHLRGIYQMPADLQQVYVSYDRPYDPFVIKLRQALAFSKVVIVEAADQAHYILYIDQISEAPSLQATSTTGQVNTYAMQYIVRIHLTDKQG